MSAEPAARRSSQGAGIPVILLVASLSVLSVALPAALVAGVPDTERSAAWWVTLLIMVWGGVRLSVLWVVGQAALFDFFFWLYTYIFMGIAPTAQIRSGEISTTTPDMDPGLDLPTALVVVLGVACYELSRLGWWLGHRHRHAAEEPTGGAVSTARTFLLVGAGFLFSAYFISKVGLGTSLGSRQAAFAARNAAWPDPPMRAVFYALATYPLLIAIGALTQLRNQLRDASGRWLSLIPVALALLVLLAVVNPISSARYTFGTVAFALAVFAGALRTPSRIRMTLLGTIVAFLFLFPIADAFRTSNVRTTRAGFFAEYQLNPDYDSFWQIANALSYWVDGLVQPLRQLLGSLFFWVPRSLWPNKPTDTGAHLAQYRGYSYENLSAPLWGEMLVNGGILAVVVGFILLGMALGAMDRRIHNAFLTSGWWALVGAVVPVYMTILLRGSLLQATGSLVVTLVCLIGVRQGRPK